MVLHTAEQQKTLTAEKQIASVRAMVIVFGTVMFFFLKNPFIHKDFAYGLMVPIWLYGGYVLYFKPYEKYPILLAAWFTYVSDCVFATLWIYATGGYYSPFQVLYYTSIIAVAFRFGLNTTLFTATLYSAAYLVMLVGLEQQETISASVIVRLGFIYIIGYLTILITKETLYQTEQKLIMQKLAEEARRHQDKLMESQGALADANEALRLRNNILTHAEENAKIGSYAWDLNADKMWYSDNLFRLLGCKPGDFEPSFKKYLSFIHPDQKDSVAKQGEDIMKNDVMETTVHRIITLKGELKHLRVSGKINAEGKSRTMIGTLQDVTADVELNEALRLNNQQLENSNNELASFNYIASHDLQEPVRKIHTFSKLVMDREPGMSENSRNYLQRVSAAAKRMQLLIEAFLNYSRLDSSSLTFEQVDLNNILEEVKQNLGDIIEEKNASVEKAVLPVINGIHIQLHQLFINLLSNALKYSKPDVAAHITVSAQQVKGRDTGNHQLEQDTAYWKIMVKDNGIGFEAKYSEKIFEVFQRLHSKDKYAGTGIGLAICKKIALAHHGAITAQGIPDEGATFNVFLPA
jgi:signal transduction histidine kinase